MGEEKSEAKAAEGGAKAAPEGTTVVLKLDLHCEGCAKKVKRAVTHFEGVEKVNVDLSANKLTVTGNVDPTLLRERVEIKTKKKVELVSPQPKKDGGAAAGDKKAADEKTTPEKKAGDDKKPKEPAVSTLMMKIRLHCDGCAHKIKRAVVKNIGGVSSVKTDSQKDLVTVTGTMDAKEITAYLQEKLKKGVEIVSPPKKDGSGGDKKVEKAEGGEKKEKEGGGGGDKKVTGGGGEKKVEKAEGGEKKEKEGGGGDKKDAAKESKPVAAGGEVVKVEASKSEYNGLIPQTHFTMPMYNQSYANQDYGIFEYHHTQGYGSMVQYSQGAPPPPPTYLDDQILSDENPNGCSVM